MNGYILRYANNSGELLKIIITGESSKAEAESLLYEYIENCRLFESVFLKYDRDNNFTWLLYPDRHAVSLLANIALDNIIDLRETKEGSH